MTPRQLFFGVLSPGQLFVVLAAAMVLANARLFYGSLKLQTEHVHLWFGERAFEDFIHGLKAPSWSAPLDDVFIHFDFARSTAHGAPFEWTRGNGYSSGGTSLLYPFILAVGYLLGQRGLELMHFAAIIACVCTFGLLLSTRRMFARLPPYWALLAPPALLSTGVLNWTLFSGMEVALFLALFGLAFILWDDLMIAIEDGTATRAQALSLGFGGALLVAGRPEAAPIVAIFGIWSALALYQQGRRRGAISNLFLVGVPGALVVLGQMGANYVLTGNTSAAGALAKLEMHHPYLTDQQVFGAWKHFVSYQFLRLSNYHFSSIIGPGYIVWALALLSVVFKKTRRYGILLWLCLIFWICLVALNGQVRWQNERYTMPAVAWLLLAAALGVASTVDAALAQKRSRTTRVVVPGFVAGAVLTFVFFQAPRFREQVWFFGRAARNILEQHIRAGAYLGHGRTPRPQRVLLSDAGALPYAAQLPAFDLIGLGGYEGLPVAGASRQGVGAAVELIEHMPPRELPDVMALYPHWWGTFVLWFGSWETEFPVRGNVICGGASKVIYQSDWSPLQGSSTPFSLNPAEVVTDAVDVADVLSERAHGASWDREAQGYVGMKMLPHPRHGERDLWDAGRLLSQGMGYSFELAAPADTLVLRVAPAKSAQLLLTRGGHASSHLEVAAADHWQELRIPLPANSDQDLSSQEMTLRVTNGEIYLYHLFGLQQKNVEIDETEKRSSRRAPRADELVRVHKWTRTNKQGSVQRHNPGEKAKSTALAPQGAGDEAPFVDGNELVRVHKRTRTGKQQSVVEHNAGKKAESPALAPEGAGDEAAFEDADEP